MNTSLHRFFSAGLFILALALTSALQAQTSHQVAVTNNVFTPKHITVNVGDTVVWTCTEGRHNVNGTIASYPNNAEGFGNALGSSWTYKYVFTRVGKNDYKCDPHVQWGMVGTVTVVEPAGEPFIDISFTGMTPHNGQQLYLALFDADSGVEVSRDEVTVSPTFTYSFGEVAEGNYRVILFADHNKNGYYDAPPADHAWEINVGAVTEPTEVSFAHNTNFTDIAWKHRLTVAFTGMTPHVGQKLTLYLRNLDTQQYVDTLMVDEIPGAAFQLMSERLVPPASYYVDFYSDHNRNGQYDAPPADHAWRISLSDVAGDTVVNFAHNTNFTNIFGSSGIGQIAESGVSIYPNPVSGVLTVQTGEFRNGTIELMNLSGQKVYSKELKEQTADLKINMLDMPAGLYFVRLTDAEKQVIQRIVRQ